MIKNNISILSLSCFLFTSLTGFYGFAGDFQWSGTYRAEAYDIRNSSLDSSKREKAYGLHHLILRPRIEAADGITIRSRFDLFNYGLSNMPSNQLGAVWGSGVGTGAPSSVHDSNVASSSQRPETLQVTELYLTIIQEFGALVVGRVPLQFGLGMVHNAGNGEFDHWMDNRDIIGYKIVMGNLFILPMYGKASEGLNLEKNDDVTDMMVQLQYENLESGVEMGFFYQGRSANSGNDIPELGNDFFVGGPGARKGRLSTRSYSLYGVKETRVFRFGVEASWQEGNLGVVTAQGEEVTMSGYGLAAELDYRPDNSKYSFGLKTGFATGDNPDTTNKFEGFIFDRNYDVAFLLFNHTLGKKNFLRTELVGTQNTDNSILTHNQPDIEALSNVYYVAPSVSYKWNEKWMLQAQVTMAWLQTDPIPGGDTDNSLGYEFDFAFNFRPNKRLSWVNQIGMLFPGAAFKGGSMNNFSTDMAYGFVSKAAISF